MPPDHQEYVKPPGPQAYVMRRDQPGGEGAQASPALLPRCLLTPLTTPFYRFLARFSGRRRTKNCSPPPWWFLLVQLVLVSSLVSIVDACSSRGTPKPRPPAPTPRPNITFPTYPCPPAHAVYYCLNGATCFTIKIQDNLLYNCVCSDGYQGSRCEYKDLDGSYTPSQRRIMLETASIAGGATIAVLSAVIFCLAAYVRWRKRKKNAALADDQVDNGGRCGRQRHREPIFGVRPHGTGQSFVPVHTENNAFGSGVRATTQLEPNLLVTDSRTEEDNTGLPHDRGDLPQGEPPWRV